METRKRIIKHAKAEFLEFGYEKASLRRIAKKAGLVPSALYRHFKDKEMLFSYFVDTALDEYYAICESDMEQVDKMLEHMEIDQMWEFSDEQFVARIQFIYKHFDAFRLLCTCSAGTKYITFQHDLVEKDVKSTMLIWKELKRKGIPVRNIDETDLHLITSGLFSSLFELVIHNYSEEEALRRTETISIFFTNGIKSVFGL